MSASAIAPTSRIVKPIPAFEEPAPLPSVGGQPKDADARHSSDGMPAQAKPEDGDVVIGQQTREGRRAYVLHTVPGPDQCLLRTQEEAARHAMRFAEWRGVRAWVTRNGSDFVLLRDLQTLRSRETALLGRQNTWHARDDAPSLREESVRTREAVAQARSELDALMCQLREANEQLVVANLRSQSLAEEADRTNHLKDEFIAVVSHELRTPLNAVLGWAQVLAPPRIGVASLRRASRRTSRSRSIPSN